MSVQNTDNFTCLHPDEYVFVIQGITKPHPLLCNSRPDYQFRCTKIQGHGKGLPFRR